MPLTWVNGTRLKVNYFAAPISPSYHLTCMRKQSQRMANVSYRALIIPSHWSVPLEMVVGSSQLKPLKQLTNPKFVFPWVFCNVICSFSAENKINPWFRVDNGYCNLSQNQKYQPNEFWNMAFMKTGYPIAFMPMRLAICISYVFGSAKFGDLHKTDLVIRVHTHILEVLLSSRSKMCV